MKPLVVGEAPSKNEHPPRPLEGRVGRRLADCCGLSLEEFLERFERMNLLDVRQDTAAKGFTFDYDQATLNASSMSKQFEPGQLVLLLGRRVATAFDLEMELFVEQHVNEARVYVLPHPSGVNRWWNEPENVKRMTEFMHGVVQGTRP